VGDLFQSEPGAEETAAPISGEKEESTEQHVDSEGDVNSSQRTSEENAASQAGESDVGESDVAPVAGDLAQASASPRRMGNSIRERIALFEAAQREEQSRLRQRHDSLEEMESQKNVAEKKKWLTQDTDRPTPPPVNAFSPETWAQRQNQVRAAAQQAAVPKPWTPRSAPRRVSEPKSAVDLESESAQEEPAAQGDEAASEVGADLASSGDDSRQSRSRGVSLRTAVDKMVGTVHDQQHEDHGGQPGPSWDEDIAPAEIKTPPPPLRPVFNVNFDAEGGDHEEFVFSPDDGHTWVSPADDWAALPEIVEEDSALLDGAIAQHKFPQPMQKIVRAIADRDAYFDMLEAELKAQAVRKQ